MNNPLRKKFTYTFFNASLILIGVNFAVYALTYINPILKQYLSLCPLLIIEKKWFWQFFTYMFTHASFMHILSNMLGLLFFGIATERALGSREFLLLYFVCGLTSGVLSFLYYLIQGHYLVFLLGASGALYSVLFSYAVIYPRAKLYIWGILPLPSPLLVAFYAAIEIFSQFSGKSANVAHYTHLFGFLVAFTYFVVRMGINPFKVWRDAYTLH